MATELVALVSREIMILRYLSVVLTVWCAFQVSAATLPTYVNTSPVFITNPPPQIDATTFINQSIFHVQDTSFQPLPYQTLNTLNFRNEAAGDMFGNPGFRFDYFTQNTRQAMDTWVNRGNIAADNFISTILTPTTIFFSPASWLMVWSDSIVNSGTLSTSPQGLIRLEGTTLNLARSRIRTGSPTNGFQFFGGSWLLSSNYFNDLGISDVWWGAGSNNVLRGQGSLMPLDSFFSPNLALPFPESALHEVVQPFTLGVGGFTTNLVSIPFFNFNNYMAVAYTNQIGTGRVVQVVFVPTNSFDTNLTVDVRFAPQFGGGATVIVGFHTRDFDVVLDRESTNSVYLLDALGAQTNVSLARNLQFQTRRPNTYEVTRDVPFQLFGSVPANTTFTNGLLYNLGYASNAVPVTYAGYRGSVAGVAFTDPGIAGSGLNDPTNYPGRVEILGQNVNFKDARIRADSSLVIKAPNLTSNNMPRVSAPFLYADLGTLEPLLTISNFVPRSVGRVAGEILAWSATWDNSDTNTGTGTRFHVLVVDHTFSSRQPVIMNHFTVKGNDIQLHDYATIQQRIKLNATSLDIKASGGVTFPPGANWAATNVLNLVNFTNRGVVNVSGATFAGTDRGYPYQNYVNRGTNTSQVHFIWADYFENPGCMAALGGAFQLDAGRVQLRGRPPLLSTFVSTNFFFSPTGIVTVVTTNGLTNAAAKITAASDIIIKANNISLSNAFLEAGAVVPGALIFCGTNRLSDSGSAATNYFLASAGIQVLAQPKVQGDLMGTYALSRLSADSIGQHIWSGVDMGAVPAGFNNNLALGKLTLEGGEDSSFRFAGAKGKKAALYVDYLELLHNATNFNTALTIDPTLVIYFANANLQASKLDNTHGGRLRWVPTFVGPLSSTNIVYPSGQTYTFNAALMRDKDIDSDGDGTVNSKDPTPVFVGENVDLTVAQTPGRVKLSWSALAGSQTHVEFKSSATATAWQTLFTTNPSVSGRLQFSDPTSNRVQRVYRVRVDIPSP